MTLIVIVAGATLLVSFICSLLEAALYAITPAKIEVMRAQGKPGAERLAEMRADVEAPIAAILTVNTIAHTLGASMCGAMVGEQYGNDGAVAIFAAVFTFLVLAFTEIVPKSLGVRYAPTLGTNIVWPLQVMIWLVWPIVWVSKKAMGLLMSSDGPKGPSEDEVVVVAGLAAQHGRMRSQEHLWVENALRLDTVTAGDLRTPRTVVETLRADTPVESVRANPAGLQHSRIPLTNGDNIDDLVGLVLRRDIFDQDSESKAATLRDLARPLQNVPEAMPAHELLELFLRERVHMVAVIDEYGGFEGVATLEDVMERLLGQQIVDEHDRNEDMQVLAKERMGENGEDGAAAGSDGSEPRG